MTAIQLLAHAVLWVAVGFAFRSICAFVAWVRNRKPAPVSPSRALGVDRGGPYRAIVEAGYRDHADLTLQVADEAVRRERARVLAIVASVGEASDAGIVKTAIKAIVGGINSGT